MVLAPPLDALAFQVMLEVAVRDGRRPGHRIAEPDAAELLDAQAALDAAEVERARLSAAGAALIARPLSPLNREGLAPGHSGGQGGTDDASRVYA